MTQGILPFFDANTTKNGERGPTDGAKYPILGVVMQVFINVVFLVQPFDAVYQKVPYGSFVLHPLKKTREYELPCSILG